MISSSRILLPSIRDEPIQKALGIPHASLGFTGNEREPALADLDLLLVNDSPQVLNDLASAEFS